MDVKIYVNPEYKDALWSTLAIKAINAEIMRKRYTPVFIDAPEVSEIDFDNLYEPGEKRLMVYIGAQLAITPAVLARFNDYGVHVVFLNYESQSLVSGHSKILLNYKDGMRKTINYLLSCGRENIALYGINPNSSTDMIKDAFFADYLAFRGGNPSRDIYYNYASQRGCYTRFAENCRSYDAVICANDVVALALICHLHEEGVRVPEDLFVVSFGSTVLASMANPTITSVSVDHEELGRQAILAYAYLYKNPGDITLTAKVDAKLRIRASTAHMPDRGKDIFASFLPQTPNVNFYDDPITQRVFEAETLLLGCDELDFGILKGILRGETYPHIAEQLFTSENVISYRIKRMCKTTSCTKKAELVALLAPYFKP